MELSVIKEDLKDIRYYYSRKELFEKASTYSVGKNNILDKIEKYNDVICSAPPRLYDLYISLYLQNHTQESLSEKLGYTFEYISRLNTQLVKYLKEQFEKQEEN